MGTFADLGNHLQLALGTEDVVNFLALHNLLRGILETLAGILGAEKAELNLPVRSAKGERMGKASDGKEKHDAEKEKKKKEKSARKKSKDPGKKIEQAKKVSPEEISEEEDSAEWELRGRDSIDLAAQRTAMPQLQEDMTAVMDRLAKLESELAHLKSNPPAPASAPAPAPAKDVQEEEAKESVKKSVSDGKSSLKSSKSKLSSEDSEEGEDLTEEDTTLLSDEQKRRLSQMKQALKDGNFEKFIQLLTADQANVMGMIQDLRSDMSKVHERMSILPDMDILYKAFFPTWKMLEDALCAPYSLDGDIIDSFDEFGDYPVGPDDAILLQRHPNKVQMIWKFLGPPGPSKRLLAMLRCVGEVVCEGAMKAPRGRTLVAKDSDGERGPFPFAPVAQSTARRSSLSSLGGSFESLDDVSFLNVKITKLSENVTTLRRHMDDVLTFKDNVTSIRDQIQELRDEQERLRKDLECKKEEDLEVLDILRMDIMSLQQGIASINEAIQTLAKSDTGRAPPIQQMRPAETQLSSDVILDKDARVRTQQLVLQMNMLHAMLLEVEGALPGFKFATSITPPPPQSIQHPWSTGRAGVGATARGSLPPGRDYGGAGPTSGRGQSPEARGAGRQDAAAGVRPNPMGQEKTDSTQRPDESHAKGGYMSKEERDAYQQEFIKINMELRRHKHRLDQYGDKHDRDIKKLVEAIRKVQLICDEHYDQVLLKLNTLESASAFGPGSPLASPDAPTMGTSSPPHSKHQSRVVGQVSVVTAQGQELLMTLRAELFSHLANIVSRLEWLENLFRDSDGALVRKPLVHSFQCLSCDKPVRVVNLRECPQAQGGGQQLPPDMPRLPPISSSPTGIRSMGGQRIHLHPGRPADIYEIPRQCGGPYTTTDRPRRFQFYTNVPDLINRAGHAAVTERVDVVGSDGHIYKGLVASRDTINRSNNMATGAPSGPPDLPALPECNHPLALLFGKYPVPPIGPPPDREEREIHRARPATPSPALTPGSPPPSGSMSDTSQRNF